ncbi:MAG: hypothetical protein LC723_12525 [Actinobacteria bacterium]|nr:hypothetical protein [Actinomycetota bacterium]
MKRRHIIVIVLAALIFPRMGWAIPRPPGTAQSAPEAQVGSTLSVNGNDSVGVSTPILTSGRPYRFEVTGVWKPTTSTTNSADAAFETTNSGTTWTHTGKGIIIGGTNYGDVASPVTAFRSDHKYSIQFTGRGVSESMRLNDPIGYGDNSGSVSVKIFTLSQVTYVFEVNQNAGQDLSVPSQSQGVPLPSGLGDTKTVTGTTVPAIDTAALQSIPVASNVTLSYRSCGENQGSRIFLSVTLNGSTQEQPVGECLLSISSPTSTSVATGSGAQTTSVHEATPVCVPNCPVSVGAVVNGFDCADVMLNSQPGTCDGKETITTFPISVPACDLSHPLNVTACNPLPPGSSVAVTISWSADTTRLWHTFVDDQSGEALWAPVNLLNPTEVSWLGSEFAKHDLPGTGLSCQTCFSVSTKVLGPGGVFVAGTQYPYWVGGVGQVLEAAFATQVRGQ